MKMKDLAKAFALVQEDKFIDKIDKEIIRLTQLRFVAKVVSVVKDLEGNMVPIILIKILNARLKNCIPFLKVGD